MSVQETSREAYHDLQPVLGDKQREVLAVFCAQKDWNYTNCELSVLLGWPINTVTPRVYELRELGFVIEACRRRCEVTGRRAIAWKVKRE